jgi:hypothetical protein
VHVCEWSIGTGRVRTCKIYLGCQILYNESIKRELKTRPINECRCDERLKTKAEESTRLTYTGLLGELEHLKVKTRLIRREVCECDG